jgi:hypothetical protein
MTAVNFVTPLNVRMLNEACGRFLSPLAWNPWDCDRPRAVCTATVGRARMLTTPLNRCRAV